MHGYQVNITNIRQVVDPATREFVWGFKARRSTQVLTDLFLDWTMLHDEIEVTKVTPLSEGGAWITGYVRTNAPAQLFLAQWPETTLG